jgi:serine/threonine-protein kinase
MERAIRIAFHGRWEIVGGYVVMRPRDSDLSTLAGVRRSLVAAGALGFLMALLAAWLAARNVTRPVRALALAMRQAADGNYAALRIDRESQEESVGEIGSLARAFDALLIDLRDKDSLGATTAAAVAVEEARRHDDEEQRGQSARRTRSDRVLAIGGPAAQPSPHFLVRRGDLLANRYRIEALIGSGGMGLVYRARDRVLAESVAVKLLRPEIMASDPAGSEQLREELRVARRITHRNVVRTHDIGESDGVPFLSMEYVEGASLETVIRVRGSLPVRR